MQKWRESIRLYQNKQYRKLRPILRVEKKKNFVNLNFSDFCLGFYGFSILSETFYVVEADMPL